MAISSLLNDTAPARFAAKFNTSNEGCWEWTARLTKDGYGQFRTGGKGSPNVPAHRVAWTLAYGDVPDGLLVLHRCDNRCCVRPDHLFVGTPADNSADMVAKARAASGSRNARFGAKDFPQPTRERRARGEHNGWARLTEDDVRVIREAYATGQWRQVDLAERFGTPQTNISRIVNRRAWAHVD